MTKNLKISLALVVGAIVVAFIAASAGSGDEPEVTSDADRSDRLVRPDSQLLSEGTSDVEFVEFLDFECEACRAAFPAVEQLREEYGDEVTFVVRNFPLHNNSVAAAKAAEAAAAQLGRRLRPHARVARVDEGVVQRRGHASHARRRQDKVRLRTSPQIAHGRRCGGGAAAVRQGPYARQWRRPHAPAEEAEALVLERREVGPLDRDHRLTVVEDHLLRNE